MKNRMRTIVLLLFAISVIAGLAARRAGCHREITGRLPTGGAILPCSPVISRFMGGVPEGRTFFPHDRLRGYVDFSVAPSLQRA